MAKFQDINSFDWLPGFKEMMACQENGEGQSSGMEDRNLISPEQNRNMGSGMPPEQNWNMESEMTPEQSRNMGSGMTPEQNRNMGSGMTPENESSDLSGLLPPEQLQREEQEYWKDYEYMIRLLPMAAREIWVTADAILDRYEFEGSSIYAEYPDKNTILKIVDLIYDKLKYYESNLTENRLDGTEGKNNYYVPEEERGIHTPLRDMILVMTVWNIAYRRQRYFRRKKVFPR